MTSPVVPPLHLSLFPSRNALLIGAFLAVLFSGLVLWWWQASWLVSLLCLSQWLLIWFAWRGWRQQQHRLQGSMRLDYQGSIRIRIGDWQHWAELGNGCLCVDWGCRVVFLNAAGKRQSIWLFRDNMSEVDYRRLCRVLTYHQRAGSRAPQQPS